MPAAGILRNGPGFDPRERHEPRGIRGIRGRRRAGCLVVGCYGFYRRVSGGAGCLPTDGNVVLRLTLVSLGHGFGRPDAMDMELARQCWKHLVPTNLLPTNRLFGAGMEVRNGLRKETPPCRSKPACAAAREAGTSGLHGRRSIPPPARKAWINKRTTGFGLWRLEKPARRQTYALSAVWQDRIRPDCK